MWKFEEKDVQFIRENFENAEELLNHENINAIIGAIEDLILYKGFDKTRDHLNEFGLKAQRVADNIFDNN